MLSSQAVAGLARLLLWRKAVNQVPNTQPSSEHLQNQQTLQLAHAELESRVSSLQKIWTLHIVQYFHWLYSPLLGTGLFFSFVIFFRQSVGLLRRVISPSQGRYLHTGQHTHRINILTDIHALSGIRNHNPSVRASEDSSCLRPWGYCDRHCPVFQTIFRKLN
jgi:hypothetical protein